MSLQSCRLVQQLRNAYSLEQAVINLQRQHTRLFEEFKGRMKKAQSGLDSQKEISKTELEALEERVSQRQRRQR